LVTPSGAYVSRPECDRTMPVLGAMEPATGEGGYGLSRMPRRVNYPALCVSVGSLETISKGNPQGRGVSEKDDKVLKSLANP